MTKVIIELNTKGPTGKRILRELKNHPKIAKINYPLPEELQGEKLYTVEEAFADLRKNVKQHFSEK